ncbi:MAG: MBL fold metallo-hydrolase [Nitrososphaerota archaeon]|nr:MBL fold metallo-hydrolase [Aigarchaeota archaeon]MDW8076434.1 MBL fold metallo-hydrolase [Nitrososphaerota archaeon]
MLRVERIVVGPLSSNSYLVYDPEINEGIIIDAGGDGDKIVALVDKTGVRVGYLCGTHAHFDHILAADYVKDVLGCKFLIHKDDAWLLEMAAKSAKKYIGDDVPKIAEPDGHLCDGHMLEVGQYILRVLHTPGHTPGSVSIVGDGVVFTGDTLFAGTVGRTDFLGGNAEQLADSLHKKLMSLPDDYVVYPGHGRSTTIGAERKNNPFIKLTKR